MIDKLEDMFLAQIELEKLHNLKYPVDIDTLEGQNKIRESIFYLVHELFEASEWMKIKPWRKTIIKTDVVEFKKEIADATHFFLQLCIILGINAKELYDLYFDKYLENIRRINDNY